LWLVKLPWHFE